MLCYSCTVPWPDKAQEQLAAQFASSAVSCTFWTVVGFWCRYWVTNLQFEGA